MPRITDRDRRKFKRDRWCGICHKLIPAGITCYVRQQVLVGECHRTWMEKNVAPGPHPEKHKRKLKAASHKVPQDIRDMSHYTAVFGRHLARESKNIIGIRRAIKDYEGTSRDW